MELLKSRNAEEALTRVAALIFLAMTGSLLAFALSLLVVPLEQNLGVVANNIASGQNVQMKSREIAQLVLSVAAVLLLGIALWKPVADRIRRPWWILFAVTLYVPALNLAIRVSNHGTYAPLSWRYAWFPFAATLLGALALWVPPRWKLGYRAALAIAGIAIAALHIPYFLPLYDMPTLDVHRASMWIFGGLYRFGDGVLPVRDLFCQYGSLQGFIGSLFIHGSYQNTINNLNAFHGLVRVAFLFSSFWALRRVGCGKPLAALAVLWLFVSQHSANTDIGGLAMVFPSVGAYRYALFPFLFICFCQYLSARPGEKRRWLVGTSVLAGTAIAWSGDAGLAQWMALFLTLGMALVVPKMKWKARGPAAIDVLLCLGVTWVSYVAVLTLIYGPGFLTADALVRPFKILLYYTGGWARNENLYPGDWLYYLINIVAPLWCALTLVSAWSSLRKNKGPHTAALIQAFLALLALATEAKYLTRTYAAYWIYDDFAFIFLAVYQLQLMYRAWGPRVGTFVPRFAVFTLAVLAFAPLTDAGRNVYGTLGYLAASDLAVPRLLNQIWPVAVPLYLKRPEVIRQNFYSTPAERELIAKHTPAGKPVMLISALDYVYYAENHRVPPYYMLPYEDNFAAKDWEEHFRRLIREADMILYDINEGNKKRTLELIRDFEIVDKADRLQVLKRKKRDA